MSHINLNERTVFIVGKAWLTLWSLRSWAISHFKFTNLNAKVWNDIGVYSDPGSILLKRILSSL